MDIENLVGRHVRYIRSDDDPAASDKDVKKCRDAGIDVLVTVDDYGFNLSWRTATTPPLRNYRCTFGDYPMPSAWELQHLNEFFLYELAHGRMAGLWCRAAGTVGRIRESVRDFFPRDAGGLADFIREKLASQWQRALAIPPALTHCTACREGACLTDLVCHVTDTGGAAAVLEKGAILSAVEARGLAGTVLTAEPRNAAGDPPDYFEYVMLTFGNCLAGDSLVLERSLGRALRPEERERPFEPGVRFYFRYADLVRHPGFRSDGYHYCKIKDALALEPYLLGIVAPEAARRRLVKAAPTRWMEKLVFLAPDGSGVAEWSARAYAAARASFGD